MSTPDSTNSELTTGQASGQGERTIRISVHPKLNRLPRGATKAQLKADKARIASASAYGMTGVEMTLAQLAEHVAAGRGFAAYMVDGHRCNESAHAQFLVLDDDLGDPEFEANVRALNRAAIIGGTVTIGHQRAFLPLNEGTSDPEVYGDWFKRLHFKFGVVVDQAGKVISQPWLGFRPGTMRIIEGASLTTAEVLSWPAPPEAAPALRREPAPLTEGQIERLDEYSRMVEQHAPAGKGKRQVFKCINPSHPDKHPSARIGDGKNGARLYYCTCGTHSLFEVAKWLNLPSYSEWLRENYPDEIKRRKPKKSVRRRMAKASAERAPSQVLSADHTLDAPLIQALPVESAALQSGVGTFKTGYTIGEVGREPGRALYLTHSETLAAQYVERARQDGVTLELYNELLKSDLYRAPRLSACINTLVLYVQATGTMPPPPDLLIIDEFTQFLEQVLIGGTMEGDELHVADQLTRYLIGSAGRVLLMDAHFSPAALRYARSARPDLPLVINTYRPARGELYLCEKRGRVIAELMAAAMAGKRVACASFSIERGQAIADQLAAIIGDPEQVLFVHRDNAGEDRQAAFLKSPNTEALKYRAVVYSPKIGTGYSIDPHLDVLAVVPGQKQSAEQVRQFMGRYRNVGKTYVWLPNNQDVRETDAQAISDRLIGAAERSAHPFIQDGRLQRSISPQARTYVEYHAAMSAERNTSLNDLRERFVSLCAGSYRIQPLTGDDPATNALMNARMAEIDLARRTLALSAPPVDADTFKHKQDAGRVTDLEQAGHIRWQIENMTGQQISERLRDRLWTESKRKAAQRFADLLDDFEALRSADFEQAAFDDPLHKRAHRAERYIITEAFLRPLLNEAGEPVEYSAAELETVYRPIIEHHAEGLRLYFRWYAYRTNTAAGILRLILRRLDLVLSGARRRVKGVENPVQFYQLDTERYHAAVETARAVVVQRKASRAAALEARIGVTVRKLQNTPISRSFAESVHPHALPGETGEGFSSVEGATLLAARLAALTQPVGGW